MRPKCSSAVRYNGRIAATISDEMSVKRLTMPSRMTVPAIRRETPPRSGSAELPGLSLIETYTRVAFAESSVCFQVLGTGLRAHEAAVALAIQRYPGPADPAHPTGRNADHQREVGHILD